MKAFVIFFQPKRTREKVPQFIIERDYKYENSIYWIQFISLESAEKATKQWEDSGKQTLDEIVVFFHAPEEYKRLATDIKTSNNLKLFIPYSSTDPLYNEVWDKIHNARGCKELISVLQYWIKNHVIDPIRLVKHRCLNLFSHISYDLQTLIELIDNKDYSELGKVANEIVQSWENLNATQSPRQSLRKLWCYLVGKHVPNINCEKYGLIYIGQEKMTLLQWLKRCSDWYSAKEEILLGESWNKLIQLCGLQEISNNFFTTNRSSKIVRLCEQIEKQVENPLNFQDILRQYSIDLMEWMDKLNSHFDELAKILLVEK